jgi:hypothetical protein
VLRVSSCVHFCAFCFWAALVGPRWEWLSHAVYVPAAGKYPVQLTYAASGTAGSVQLASGGADVSESVALADTADEFATLDLGSAQLTAGVQTLRVVFSGTPAGVQFSDLVVQAP